MYYTKKDKLLIGNNGLNDESYIEKTSVDNALFFEMKALDKIKNINKSHSATEIATIATLWAKQNISEDSNVTVGGIIKVLDIKGYNLKVIDDDIYFNVSKSSIHKALD